MAITALNSINCPSDKDLLAFFRSDLPEPEMDQVHKHVETCDQCILFVDQIGDESDTIVKALSTLTSTDDDEPEYRQLRATLLRSPESVDSTVSFAELTDDETDRPDPHDRIGSRVDDYEILNLLGHGANGAVYHARHLRLDREFAIKLLLPTGSNIDRSLQRFENEMKAVGRLDHPNIVRATHAGESNGEHFYVMEYVEGIDVSTLVRRAGTLQVADAVEIARQAAVGLSFAHHAGMVHRDVKPSNLLFGFDGNVRVLDLGLVSLGDDAEKPFTALARGTADYMAPEQWDHYDQVDRRADVYSLGCTLFKLLSGHAPYIPIPADFSSKMQAHQFAQIPSIRKRRGDVPLGLDRIIRRMLSKKVDDRYGSMEEAIVAMSPYAEGADLKRLVDQLCGRPQTQTPDIKTGKPRLLTRRRALTGIAAGLAAALVGQKFFPINNDQTLQFDVWRPMQSTKPNRILSAGEARSFDFDAAKSEYHISTTECSIYPTGRPIHAKFVMQVNVSLLTDESAAGLFFAYRPEKRQVGTHHPFEAVYLQKVGDELILKWARMRWDYSRLESRVEEDPLGNTTFPKRIPRGTFALTVELGSSAIPIVSVSGQRIDPGRWHLSHEGTIASRMPDTDLGARFDGQVGLFVARSKASFKQPRLKYIE